MIGRIVEIAQDSRHLAVHRGFLTVHCRDEEIGRISLDDIAGVVCTAHGVTYSNNLLVALAERNIPLSINNSSFLPTAMLWPLDGNYEQGGRIQAQLAATKPLSKRAWATVIRAKIDQQAMVLQAVGSPSAALQRLRKQVRSGDPKNIEAQAARVYWPLLLGKDFRRDRNAPGVNGLLNYGYTILRAATARAVVCAGLHPGVGIHHRNQMNSMPLVDDLMEPVRPLMDWRVYHLQSCGHTSVDTTTKRVLVETLAQDVSSAQGVSPVSMCLHRFAQSLAACYLEPSVPLEPPPTASRIDLTAMIPELDPC